MEIDLVQIIGIVRGHKPTPFTQRRGIAQAIMKFSPWRTAVPLTRIRVGIDGRLVVLRGITVEIRLFILADIDIHRPGHVLQLDNHVCGVERHVDQEILALARLKINIDPPATDQAQVFDGIHRKRKIMYHAGERHRTVHHVKLPDPHCRFPLEIIQATGAISPHDTGSHVRNNIQIVIVIEQEICRIRLARQRVGQRVVVQNHRVPVVTQLSPQIADFLMVNRADRSDPAHVIVRLPHIDSKDGHPARIGCRAIRDHPRQWHHVQVAAVAKSTKRRAARQAN